MILLFEYCISKVLLLSSTPIVGVMITTHPMDQNTNVDEAATFMCEATGSPPISYQWLYNGLELMDRLMYVSGATTNTLTVTNQFGMYSCVASNSINNVTSNQASLTGKQRFEFNKQACCMWNPSRH